MDSVEKEFPGRQPTLLVGRETEIASIKEQLLREDVRLLSLIGPAGVGKTRLAITVLDEIRQAFTRIVFVDLSLINDPGQVLPSIARSCGVMGGAAGQLSSRLSRAIGSRSFLLVLDNCEHVLDAMPELSNLLGSCPGLKILATSREILRLQWERVFPVMPLPVPDLKKLPELRILAQVPSVTLFLQRAQARNAGFALTAKNARIIAEICVRLDGIPLAIELAATQVNSIGPEALLQHLSQQLILEVHSNRDAPAHHNTLRTAIDRSYEQLDPEEKILFRRLSVFSGGWTLPAAEEICAGDGLESKEILTLLAHLVDCSLVLVRDQTDGKVRYRFPEIIRDYAGELLRKSGEEETLRRRHRNWFLAWAERNESGSWGHGMPVWLEDVETDFSNFWTALEWSRKTPGEHQAGLLMWAALSRFWDIRGHFIDGFAIARELLKLAPEHTVARARALLQAGILARSQGDGVNTRYLAEESLVLSRELGDVLAASASLAVLGSLAQATGQTDRAEAIFAEAVMLSRSHKENDPRPLYIALFWQGQFYSLMNQNDRAFIIFEEALELAQRQSDSNFNALILTGMGRALLGRGDFESARAILLEGLHSCQKLDYHELTAYCLGFLGQIAWMQKERQRAIRLLGTAAELRTRVGIITWIPDPGLARTVSDLGEEDLRAAQSYAHNLSLEEAIAWALSPEALQAQPVNLSSGAPAPLSLLSPREMEVAGLITQGLSNLRIADKLYVSKRTVDAHIRHILDKLRLNSRTQVSSWFTAHYHSNTDTDSK